MRAQGKLCLYILYFLEKSYSPYLLLYIIIFYVKYWCMGVRHAILTLREEHQLQVSENRVLRRVFDPERKEVVGGWRRP
jgi:hypothetical protein